MSTLFLKIFNYFFLKIFNYLTIKTSFIDFNSAHPPISAVHRICTCKSFLTNGFQDRSLTTRTYGIIKCDLWESNPYLQIHNLRYWPLYESHSDPSGESTSRKQPSGLFLVGSGRAMLNPDRAKRDSNPTFPDWKPGELTIYSMGPYNIPSVRFELTLYRA